jgi:hypothetical protein
MLDVFFRDNAEQRLLLVWHRYRHGNRLVQSPNSRTDQKTRSTST